MILQHSAAVLTAKGDFRPFNRQIQPFAEKLPPLNGKNK
jgi:hypothetical protein